MPKIQVLPEEIINKIAAGEVIERPASVVKELVENSLDAQATQIIITLENYGKDLIRIQDNGEGMDEEDARNSIIRHATSKIASVDDLFNLSTLGFRGEALASIAAVSKLTLITRRKESMEGFCLQIEGGAIKNSGITAAGQGTILEIRDLFFNTPARKKFLKSEVVELRHILDVVTSYALLHKEVGFKVLHNGREVVHSPAVGDFRSNIAAIYGTDVAKELLAVQAETETVTITGFVGKPHQARNDKQQQVLFINNRWVRNEDIAKAVYEAFHSVLFVGKHPLFLLHLDLHPERIDVNIHPHKMEVKIEQKEEVCTAVSTAVRQTLRRNNLIPTLDFNVEQPILNPNTTKKQNKYAFEPAQQTFLRVQEPVSYQIPPEVTTVIAKEIPAVTFQNSLKLPAMRLLGQIHKTFFVAETGGGVLFIDQHAAHERVLYEEFMAQFLHKQVQTQALLHENVLECSAREKIILEQNLSLLEQFGFAIEQFGEQTFAIKTVPSLFGWTQSIAMLHDIIETLSEKVNRLEEVKEEIITRMACRAAVMAGEVLSIPEMDVILHDLEKTELPYTCPHGRPTIIKTAVEELEKKFKRKG